MPMLKYIIQNAVQPELRLLRGKTIECISLIGLAVGRDKFLVDCGEIMQLLLKSQTQEAQDETADDDPQVRSHENIMMIFSKTNISAYVVSTQQVEHDLCSCFFLEVNF